MRSTRITASTPTGMRACCCRAERGTRSRAPGCPSKPRQAAPPEGTAQMVETSKAVRISWFGGPDALNIDASEIPQPRDDEVLVRVAAASLNPVDYKIREGKYWAVKEDDLPVILGRDLAGTIEACGTSAHDMPSKGDAVFAFIGQDRGAQSDYVVVKAVELVAAHKSIDLVHAAVVALARMTAWQGLFDHGGLAEGQSVLIHGGAGGVGHLAIQLAKAKGATVFTTSSERDLDFVR